MNVYILPQKLIILPKFSKISLKFLWTLGFMLVILLLAFYVFQVSAFSLESYQLQNYQKNIAGLSEQNRALEVNFARIDALENVTPKVEELGFEKIDEVYYIQILDSSLVVK